MVIDKEEISQYLDEYRPFKSQQDIYEDTGSQRDAPDLKNANGLSPIQRRRLRTMEELAKKMHEIFVRNSFMQKLYPSLKIQKPGIDFYQHMLSVQVLMCLYILIWYPNMAAEEETIIKQINKSQFSGYMVVVLAMMIIIMIIDRYIYKSRTFRQQDSSDRSASSELKSSNRDTRRISE